jgi:hypothetical protein
MLYRGGKEGAGRHTHTRLFFKETRAFYGNFTRRDKKKRQEGQAPLVSDL